MTEEFKIERGIPIPLTLSEKMPLDEMKVGDSFFVATPEDKTQSQLRNHVSSTVTPYAKRIGKRFTTRKVDGGVRVWRIEDCVTKRAAA